MDPKADFVFGGLFSTQNESVKSIQLVFSNNLRRIRKRRKLTQEQLAESIGRSPRYIQALEAGDYWPSAETMDELIHTLRCDPTDFFSK